MRVGMLAPISWRVPPRHYGPWELVVSLLTERLVARGVDVTLFASGDSQTAARLRSVAPRPWSEDPSLQPKVWECLHIAEAFEHAGEFDLLHNHFDFLPLTYTRLVTTPVLTTIHGFSSAGILPVYERYDDRVHYVSISDADRSPLLSYAATVHNGIDLGQFTYRAAAGDGLLFLGRISPEKGTAEAVAVAHKTGRPLTIAGIIQDEDYFASEVEPHVDGSFVRYLGSVGPEQRDRLLGESAAVLHLVNFAEPFGLTMVEALATGTPVIGRPRGSVPEVVRDGVTGFLVEGVDEAVGAVQRLGELDRGICRREAEERFSADRMADGYLEVYKRILS
jgi:glycosyltransferase involved in cell wall biosynthesis